MSCEQIALLPGGRREPVPPERNVLNNWIELRTGREVRLETRRKDDEIKPENSRVSLNYCCVSFVADRAPCTIGMPHEVLEPATAPKCILRWRYRKLHQNVTHESPALEVG